MQNAATLQDLGFEAENSVTKQKQSLVKHLSLTKARPFTTGGYAYIGTCSDVVGEFTGYLNDRVFSPEELKDILMKAVDENQSVKRDDIHDNFGTIQACARLLNDTEFEGALEIRILQAKMVVGKHGYAIGDVRFSLTSEQLEEKGERDIMQRLEKIDADESGIRTHVEEIKAITEAIPELKTKDSVVDAVKSTVTVILERGYLTFAHLLAKNFSIPSSPAQKENLIKAFREEVSRVYLDHGSDASTLHSRVFEISAAKTYFDISDEDIAPQGREIIKGIMKRGGDRQYFNELQYQLPTLFTDEMIRKTALALATGTQDPDFMCDLVDSFKIPLEDGALKQRIEEHAIETLQNEGAPIRPSLKSILSAKLLDSERYETAVLEASESVTTVERARLLMYDIHPGRPTTSPHREAYVALVHRTSRIIEREQTPEQAGHVYTRVNYDIPEPPELTRSKKLYPMALKILKFLKEPRTAPTVFATSIEEKAAILEYTLTLACNIAGRPTSSRAEALDVYTLINQYPHLQENAEKIVGSFVVDLLNEGNLRQAYYLMDEGKFGDISGGQSAEAMKNGVKKIMETGEAGNFKKTYKDWANKPLATKVMDSAIVETMKECLESGDIRKISRAATYYATMKNSSATIASFSRDPENTELLHRAMQYVLTECDLEQAVYFSNCFDHLKLPAELEASLAGPAIEGEMLVARQRVRRAVGNLFEKPVPPESAPPEKVS